MDELLPLSPPLARATLLVAGIALLAAGRRLFWLAVATLGFLAGLWAIESWASELAQPTGLLLALGAGIAGLLLALLVQKVAVVVGGFLLGLAVLSRLLPAVGIDLGPWQPVAVVVGAVLVAVLALALFALALTLLTAGAGAALVVEGAQVHGALGSMLLLVLWALGAVVQMKQLRAKS
jgi:hypothetical protein